MSNASDRDRLLRIAGQVADGDAIDWERARDELGDDPALLDRLSTLEKLFGVMRRAATDPESLWDLDNWGHLKILEPLGRGGFGTVYRAFDPTLQREVAVKFRRPGAGGISNDEWIAEARRLARVRHPNVLAVHGADVHEGIPGLWSDRVDGQTLNRSVPDSGMVIERALAIALQIAEAIEAVHATGIVHGDIKPSNIMLEPGDRVILMDFGAGSELAPDTEEGPDSGSAGTPLVMAPERFDGSGPSQPADIYSFGVVIFYLMTGRYPVEADSLEQLIDRLRADRHRSLKRSAPRAPHTLDRLVERMTARDPARRPGIDAVISALKRIQDAPRRRKRLVTVTSVILLLSAGLVAALVGYHRASSAEQETAVVNQFVMRMLAAPRGTESGPNVLVTDVLDDALIAAENEFAERPHLLARVLGLIGQTRVSLREFESAEALLLRARELYIQVYGAEDARTVATLDLIARCEAETGRREAAESRFRQMIAQSQGTAPAVQRNAVNARAGLAGLLLEDNRFDEAEALLEDALRIGVAETFFVASAANRARWLLGTLQTRTGRFVEAQGTLEQALDWMDEHHGKRHFNGLSVRLNLVELLTSTGQLERAEHLARETLSVVRDWLGDEHLYMVMSMSALSNVLHDQGQTAEAREWIERAIEIATTILRDNDARLYVLQSNQVARDLEEGLFEEALVRAESLQPQIEQHLGPHHQTALTNGYNLAEAQFRLEQYSNALRQAERIGERMAETLGPGHPFVGVADGLAGAALGRLGEHAAAGALLESALSLLTERLGPEHTLTLDIAAYQAENLWRLGRLEEARELAERTLSVRHATLGEAHSRTRELEWLLEQIDARSVN